MRPDALRPATAAAAAKTRPKLTTRLSKGEKRNRRRMAEVGTVFDATTAPRSSADILPTNDTERAQVDPGPATSNKWLTASIVADAASVVAQIFAEADRRDPTHARPGSPSSTATTIRSSGSPPKPTHAPCRSPS